MFITRMLWWVGFVCAIGLMALVAVVLFLFFGLLLLAFPLVVLFA